MSSKNFPYRYLRIFVAMGVFNAALDAFVFVRVPAARLMHCQFAPAAMRFAAGLSIGAAVTVVLIALSALLFGRFYCACFCPLGILQDLIGWISRRKCTPLPDLAKTRYAVAAFAWGMLAAGSALPLLLLDPYSNFGRIFASGLTVGGVIPLVVIAALSIWKKRLFCVAVCPVGTVLGIFSRFSLFRLKLNDSCVKCGSCVKNCPAGCIDLATGKLDNERCVRCLNCVSVCKLHGVGFALPGREEIRFDGDRRAALARIGAVVAGAAAGVVLAKAHTAARAIVALDTLKRRLSILPPGALDINRFADKCTACQLCVANCPKKIIVPAPHGDGPVALDLSRGACDYDCHRCSQLCPTGALLPLSLDRKRRLKIAEARFDPKKCLVFQEEIPCGKCASACPAGAITLRKSGAPRLKTALCIGCGACQQACPVPGKAMSVHAIEKQEFINGNG